MPLYTKASKDEVYDLINSANPTLAFPVSPTNVNLGLPTATVVSGQPTLNTKIAVSCKQSDGTYVGRNSLNYRRRSLSSLFRALTVQIDLYAPPVAAGAVAYTIYQLLPYINAKYGMFLTTDDVVDAPIVYGSTLEGGFNTTTVSVVAKSTSLGYIDSFALKWKSAPQDLGTMIAVNDLPGRLYPGGNDFSGTHKNIVNFMGYSTDWTDIIVANPWYNFPASNLTIDNTGPTNGFMAVFLAEINRQYGTSYTAVNMAALAKTITTYNLPSALLPEGNRLYYNRCVVIDLADGVADTIGVGRFFIHYNV